MNEPTPDESSIRTVDLADLAHHDAAVRREATDNILIGFGENGVVFLANHGVDFALRDRVYRRFVELTDRAREEKEPLRRADLWSQRGWTTGGEDDPEESYRACPSSTDRFCKIEYPEIFADNVWPDGDEDFARDYRALGQQIHEAGLSLLQGVSMALGLPMRCFDPRVEGAAHVLRLVRDESGGEEHTDFSLLTLRPGPLYLGPDGSPCDAPDEAAGLYVRSHGGDPVQVRAPEGCIVAQVGEPLEILTGGSVPATPHAVTAPTTDGSTRVSAAHGLQLHPYQLLFPFEAFRTDDTVRMYSPPVLAGTYRLKTLVDLGLAPESALARLGHRRSAGAAEDVGSADVG